MTRRTKRSSSHSLNSPPTSAAASRRRHHRKSTPKTSDDDYSDASQSEPESIGIPCQLESEPDSPSPQFSPTNQIEPSASHRTPPYIPIAPLPIFHGGSSEYALTHLSRFNKFCRANFSHPSTDLMMRIFPVTLENEAALWYDLNIDPYPSFTWEEIRSLFLQAYDQIGQLGTELTMIKQDRNESVRSYFLRLQWILKRWPEHGLEDNVIKGVFVDGLREEFRAWIVAEKPGSLNDALRLAFGLEQVRTMRIECRFCGCEGHEEKGCEVRERMRELWVKSKEEEEEKELVTAVSGRRRSGEGEEEEVGKKKRQCQCWKHQCWKKKLERSKSLIVSSSGNFNADEKF